MLPDPIPLLRSFFLDRYRRGLGTVHVELNAPRKKRSQNRIRSTKYTVYSFLPLSLFDQLRKVSNLYFILSTVIAFFPLSPVSPVASVIPLAVVIGISVLKDAIEDFKRYRADRQNNERLIQVIRADGSVHTVRSKHLWAGALVLLNDNDLVPADLILLRSLNDDGTTYLNTAQLDGETNLKLRLALPELQSISADAWHRQQATIEAEPPNADLYRFQARITLRGDANQMITRALDAQQFLPQGSQIKNNAVLATPVYTGTLTKLSLNQLRPRGKFSRMERRLNWAVVAVFAVQQFWLLFFAIAAGVWRATHHVPSHLWYLHSYDSRSVVTTMLRAYVEYFVLLNTFIPISLWVTLELVRMVQAWFMEHDQTLAVWNNDTGKQRGMVVKTSNLNEDLGEVQILFTDKTGTLTRNEMRLRAVMAATPSREPRLLQAMALCHSLLNIRSGEAADELAIVAGAAERGVEFIERSRGGTELTVSINGQVERFTVEATLPFKSERRRMTVVLRDAAGRVSVLTKGAEDVVFERLGESEHALLAQLQPVIEEYARSWRVLVFAGRELSVEQFEEFKQRYDVETAALDNRTERIEQCFDMIERDLELLGCTAVEDMLAADVGATIGALSEAGVTVFMLTGDRPETAVYIGITTQLVDPRVPPLFIRNCSSVEQCLQQIEAHSSSLLNAAERNATVVIDGASLGFAVSAAARKQFVDLCDHCRSVICARCTPLQKSQVVAAVKAVHRDKLTLAIGDGANDVSMILEAGIGVGLFGKEGHQAALAADYAIHEFRHLATLLFVHGRWNARRVAGLICYSFFKNIAFVTAQIVFAFYSAYSGQTLFDPWIISFYNAFFTALPPFVYGIFEQDLNRSECLAHPNAYRTQQKRQLTVWTLGASILYAACVGILCFYSVYGIREAAIDGDGHVLSLYDSGLIISIAITMVADLAMLIFMNYWTVLTVGGVILSILIFWAFLLPYSVIIWWQQKVGNIYKSIYELAGTSNFWFVLLWSIVVSLCIYFLAKCLCWWFCPADWQLILERRRLEQRANNPAAAVAPPLAVAVHEL